MFIRSTVAVAAALLVAPISAKTDYAGCVSSETVAYGGASLIWYVPDTGEICQYLDCGGGRAPPKTTVPGCAAYAGTASYTPSYLPGFGSDATPSSTAAAAGSAEESVTTTAAATSVATTEATATTDASGLPTITGDVTALSGTVGTITSAATLATTTSSGKSSMSTASSSSSTAASASNVSTAAGSMATAGPMALLIGACVGVAML
ncbi:hypothetical protein E8E14_003504 [Neopestalotiopsis sp. 37M]|nr:hypothetical protein E8E14_003504 [Neopestalotiopsis sp. 37M]